MLLQNKELNRSHSASYEQLSKTEVSEKSSRDMKTDRIGSSKDVAYNAFLLNASPMEANEKNAKKFAKIVLVPKKQRIFGT